MTNEDLIKTVNDIFFCNVMAENRKQHNVYGRIAISNYLRNICKLKLEYIGLVLSKKHETIIYYNLQHLELYRTNKKYQINYDNFVKKALYF